MLDHLVAPHQPGSKLTTVNVPRISLAMVVECINDGHSVHAISWVCSETGTRVYAADLVPAPGGVLVIEGAHRAHIPVVVSRVLKSGRMSVYLECPTCQAACTTMYLMAAGPDGEPLTVGPRCRKCSSLPLGSNRLLFNGAFARRLSVACLESLWRSGPGRAAADPGLQAIAAQARAADGSAAEPVG